jgi:hypothetical protein
MVWKGEKQRHSTAKRGIRTTSTTKRSVACGKRKEIDWGKGYLTEAEVNLIKTRMNRGEKVDLTSLYEKGGIKLTKDQEKKGYDWLMNLWKTPKGVERKNNPFGYREQHVLENFSHFELADMYNAGRMTDFYVPYYRVVSKDGRTFEYYGGGDRINILG